MKSNSTVNFILDQNSHTELIICRQSTLSYPLHSHVSVYTIGILSEGAVSTYTMITFCIDKAKFAAGSCPAKPSPFDILKSELEQAPEKQLTIEEMANMTHISKYHFIRSFKQEIGLTPHQFQLQNRIRKAKLLLRQDKTITEAALDAGFYDQSHSIPDTDSVSCNYLMGFQLRLMDMISNLFIRINPYQMIAELPVRLFGSNDML
ncbi:MAG: helix-turn-helix transcriptional regulator [Clostridiales bacterium]|nr:helix-turn-helix transcriptional regulator [Clostridiales bacterium]